jgi:ABC-type transport system involved in multi-copper enzyme maturation permease subunit
MLWHKAWIDTRWRCLIGLAVLLLSAMGTVFGYQLVSSKALDISSPQGSGMVAAAIREALELSRTFKGYVWLNAFSQNLSQLATLFAILLGAGALRSEAPGTLYTLSLPFSRRALMTTRAATGLAELLAMTMVSALAIAVLAPAIGERYPVVDALVHGVCLFAGTAVFFSLTFLLSTWFPDPWRPPIIACGIAVVIAMIETLFSGVAPLGIYHVIHGESYFRGNGIPWLGLLVVVALSAVLLRLAIATIERQDF